jgi:hypothetical protein
VRGRKKFRVGVFTEQRARGPSYRAYTTWFNPAWEGCRVFEVDATNGTEAKRMAIDIAKLADSAGSHAR